MPFQLKVLTLARSKSVGWFEAAGIKVVEEGFVDRRYESDGTLRARHFDNALITDSHEVAAQAVKMVRDKIITSVDKTEISLSAQTLCIHGDSKDAVKIASKVREELEAAHIKVRCF